MSKNIKEKQDERGIKTRTWSRRIATPKWNDESLTITINKKIITETIDSTGKKTRKEDIEEIGNFFFGEVIEKKDLLAIRDLNEKCYIIKKDGRYFVSVIKSGLRFPQDFRCLGYHKCVKQQSAESPCARFNTLRDSLGCKKIRDIKKSRIESYSFITYGVEFCEHKTGNNMILYNSSILVLECSHYSTPTARKRRYRENELKKIIEKREYKPVSRGDSRYII